MIGDDIVVKKSANQVDALVGKKIRARRTAVDMSQSELGKALGITFQQVQKYESGTNRVGAGRLYDIAKLLGVPVSYFYEGLYQHPDVEEPVSDETLIAQALERIRQRSQRELAKRLVMALLKEFEAD